MIRTQIQLTPEQADVVRRRANDQGISAAEVVRQAIDQHLSAGSSMQARREKARASVGGFRSGNSDASVEHDKYLDEAFDD